MTDLAPIILFVYNRPKHTKDTLEALSKNKLSSQSDLIVFCDGPKDINNPSLLSTIKEVRKIVANQNWSKTLKIVNREKNFGLAKNIIQGVSEVLGEYHKAIILEDDIITSPNFLVFMNQGLNLYKNDPKVMHISGYLPETNFNEELPNSFFVKFMSCWGWATWESTWKKLNMDAQFLLNNLKNKNLLQEFNLNYTQKFDRQLKRNISGDLNTWAIKWYASIFLNNGFCLYPEKTLCANIGKDGSGENYNSNFFTNNDNPHFFNFNINLNRVPIENSNIGNLYLEQYYKYGKKRTFLSILEWWARKYYNILLRVFSK